MRQIAVNTPEQAMSGDFPKAVEDAVLESGEAHENQMMPLLESPRKAAQFAAIVLDMLRHAARSSV